MPRLLDHMPFPHEPGEVSVHGERVRIRANQIILWMSLTLRRVMSPNPIATPFPVVLDTGHTHSLSLHERHLVEAERGIAVYPAGDFPRLPILGLRAIAENGLILHIDGPRRRATLRTPTWWPFG